MPVRKIPKNHIHVTGRHASRKSQGDADFESMLEAEHLLLLDHEPSVRTYEVQPVNIPVTGVPRGYVPDVLVDFFPDVDGVIQTPELREVKSTLDLKSNAAKYAPKFDAAKTYCEQRGWLFRVITELEIRTPRLANVKFLKAYEDQQHPQEMLCVVMDRVSELGQTDSKELVSSISVDLDEQMVWMPVLWHLVAKRQIQVDLDKEFGAVVPIWPLGVKRG